MQAKSQTMSPTQYQIEDIFLFLLFIVFLFVCLSASCFPSLIICKCYLDNRERENRKKKKKQRNCFNENGNATYRSRTIQICGSPNC